MTEIQKGDKVTVSVNDIGGRVAGTVTELYDNGIGKRVVVIDIPGYGPFHQITEFVTLQTMLIKCVAAGCNSFTMALPRSRFCCPDHLDQIFDNDRGPETPC